MAVSSRGEEDACSRILRSYHTLCRPIISKFIESLPPGPRRLTALAPPFDPNTPLLSATSTSITANLPNQDSHTCSNAHLTFSSEEEASIHWFEWHWRNSTPAANHLSSSRTVEWCETSYSASNPAVTLLDLLHFHVRLAAIRSCNSPACLRRRTRLSHTLPACRAWPLFRDWMLTAVPCAAAAAEEGFPWHDAFTGIGLAKIVARKMGSMEGEGRGGGGGRGGDDDDNDAGADLLFEVCELVYFWVAQVALPARLGADAGGGGLAPAVLQGAARRWWRKGFLPRSVTLPAVGRAERIATRELGICPSRLWNLAHCAERGEDDVPALVEVVVRSTRPGAFKHEGHGECSAEFCHFADENSTLKKQLHKCDGGRCSQFVTFPLEKLDDAVKEEYRPTPWRIDHLAAMSLWPNPDRYIAISHVWSDGTGVGVGTPGKVNQCLFSYFVDIARELECDGIWWDTVCVPIGKKARRIAIGSMHRNYEDAAYTVIHDEYLLQIDWADDGSPALALVLSPWFTRGWTALELSMSRRVKVIFRDPNDRSKQVLKDLDDDVLAHGTSRGFPSLGHIIASALIRRLRERQPRISDLLLVLSTRTTSWARDRICIAGLLARTEDFEYNDSLKETTRKIMKTYKRIPKRFLLHGHVPLSDIGGLSWCPSNLLHGELAMAEERDHDGDQDEVSVDQNGMAYGRWQYRELTAEDRARLRPHSFHLSVEFRIKQALEKWDHCLLLFRSSSIGSFEPAILVSVTELLVTDETEIIECRYAGSVFDVHIPNPEALLADDDKRNRTRRIVSDYKREFGIPQLSHSTITFKIGCSADKSSQRVGDIMQNYYAVSAERTRREKAKRLANDPEFAAAWRNR